MTYVLHLRDVPPSADEGVIRRSFSKFSIPKGGISILGGVNGDVLVDFDDESEILQALAFDGIPIHGRQIKVLLERAEDKSQVIADVLKGLVSAPKTLDEIRQVNKRLPSKPVDKRQAISSSTPAAVKVAPRDSKAAGTAASAENEHSAHIAAAPWNIKPATAQAAHSKDSKAASQKTPGQTASISQSLKSSVPPWASKGGQTGNQKMVKSAKLKPDHPKVTAAPWASKLAPSPSPRDVPPPASQLPAPQPQLSGGIGLTTRPPVSTGNQMMNQVMQNTSLPQPQLSGGIGPTTRPPISTGNQMMNQVKQNTSFPQPQLSGVGTTTGPPKSTGNQMMKQVMQNTSLPQPQLSGVGMTTSPPISTGNQTMNKVMQNTSLPQPQMHTRPPISTGYQMMNQIMQNTSLPQPLMSGGIGLATRPRMSTGYQMMNHVMQNTLPQPQLSIGLTARPCMSANYPWGPQAPPFRQMVPAPTIRPLMSTNIAWRSPVATSPCPLPVPSSTPEVALAADVARYVSMGTNRFSSPNPVGTPFNQSNRALLMRAITPQNNAPSTSNLTSNSKNMPTLNPSLTASHNLNTEGLKQQKPQAKPVVKNPISEVIVVKESDDSSSDDDEYQVKVKKSKVGDSSEANIVKSLSDKEPIKNRIYRSRGRSRSTSREKAGSRCRSRSRSRSRSQPKSQKSRGRDRSSSREKDMFGSDRRRRDRSRSRGRERSKETNKYFSTTMGRNCFGSSGKERSKSRDRHRSRSKSRDRHRSRSKGRDRSRERDRDQRSRKADKDNSKPADTTLPSLVQYPDRMNIGTGKFKNDPNSIIVLNIQKTVSMYLFKKLFYGHAIVQDGIALKPSENNPNVQTGYVKFVYKSSVEAAKKLSGTPLDGRKVVIKSASENESEPPTEPEYRETQKSQLKTLDIPPPKESPFRMLGASEETTCYIATIRGFKLGTTACEVWSWFGGPTGHAKGVIVSHRMQKKDDEAAFVVFDNVTSRNAMKLPRDVTNISQYRYTEHATIRKLLSDDVSILTESTLLGQDRAVRESEKKRLEVLSSQLLNLSQSAPEEPLWKQYIYLCLHETPKGTTATQVWSWLGGKNGRAECVILAHCTSQNELQDGRFHVAFVGFEESRFVKQEMQRLGHGKLYTPDETMRFLARQPDNCPIFLTTTFGQDRVLPKTEREQLREKYLTKKEVSEKQRSEPPKQTPIPIGREFGLSDEFSGMCLLQHKLIPKTSTACKVWSWHQLETNKCRGVVLVKDPNDNAPRTAFAVFDDAEVRNEAHKARQFTGKVTWDSGICNVANWASNRASIFISTKSGIDRPITYEESRYLIQCRDANTGSNDFTSSGSPMDIEETSDGEEEQNLGMVTPRPQTSGNNQNMDKGAAIAAVAAGDNSDQYYYLRIRKLPENVTAYRVWTWFDGAAGNSKSALVVYGANKVAACAYIGFEREIHRDMAITNQRFTKPCNYHSRGVHLTELEPGFKIMESTLSGLDKEFTELDMDVMKYKLQQIAEQKRAEKPVSNVTAPITITQALTQVADMRSQLQMPSPKVRQEDRNARLHPQMTAFNPNEQNMWAQGRQGVSVPKKGHANPRTQENQHSTSQWDIQDEVAEEPRPEEPEPILRAPKLQPPGTERRSGQEQDAVEYMLQAENTIYFRLIKLRPNITAGEVWSWFRGSRGPTRCATLVRDSDGTALFAYVGFVSDHTSFIENFEIGSFTLCGPKARNIELISLDTSVQVIQSSKQGDKRVSAETMKRFKERVLSEKKTGSTNTHREDAHQGNTDRSRQEYEAREPESLGTLRSPSNLQGRREYEAREPESKETLKLPSNLQGLTARILQMGKPT